MRSTIHQLAAIKSNAASKTKNTTLAAAVALALLSGMQKGQSQNWIQQSPVFQNQWTVTNFSIPDSVTAWTVADNVAPLFVSSTTDGGANWQMVLVTGADSMQASNIDALNKDTAWVSSWNIFLWGGKIFKTTDAGVTWTEQTNPSMFPVSTGFLNYVHFFDANNGVALGDPTTGYFEIHVSSDGGSTWARVPSSAIPPPLSGETSFPHSVSAHNGHIWFGTSKGRVFHSSDRGNTWAAVAAAASTVSLAEVTFTDTLNGVARSGSILRSTSDGGSTWSAPYNPAFNIQFISGIPGTTGTYVSSIAQTSGYGSAVSTDGGYSWVKLDSGLCHSRMNFLDAKTGYSGACDAVNPSHVYKWNCTTLGVNGLNNEGSIRMFPNPTNGPVEIQSEFRINAMEVMNMLGKKIDGRDVKGNRCRLDLSCFADGVYFIRIYNEKGISTEKLVLKK